MDVFKLYVYIYVWCVSLYKHQFKHKIVQKSELRLLNEAHSFIYRYVQYSNRTYTTPVEHTPATLIEQSLLLFGKSRVWIIEV